MQIFNIFQYLPDLVREFVLWGNTGEQYILAFLVFLLILTVFRTFHHALIWRLEVFSKKTSIKLDDVLIRMVKRIRWWFYIVLSLYGAFWLLYLEERVYQAANIVFIIVVVYQAVQSVGILVEYIVQHKISDEGDEGQAQAISQVFTKLIKGILWVLALLFVLSNLGIDITSLITGLGIGGVAVALALQTILSDLFSSFAIYFDKPFEVGDFIIVGDKMGTVEAIGIKTTRIRALAGEEIIFSNRELTSAQIHNYRGTDEFRGTFSVGVTYDTSPDDLDKAQKIITEVIRENNNVRPDRVNVSEFSDSAITFEAAFYTNTPEYSHHLATKHAILREVKRRFEKEKIEFAFPTRTVYMHK